MGFTLATAVVWVDLVIKKSFSHQIVAPELLLPASPHSRALLLMAAQGKSSREETFDQATAHNGFSGIQPYGLGEETKV